MQNIEVTPQIARQIFSDAVSSGVTVEVYLQKVMSKARQTEEPPLSDLLKDLTAKIDSSLPDSNNYASTEFGRALIEKFKKQGLKKP